MDNHLTLGITIYTLIPLYLEFLYNYILYILNQAFQS